MKAALKKSKVYRSFRQSRIYDEFDHLRRLRRDTDYAEHDRAARADFEIFRDQCGGSHLSVDVRPHNGTAKTALILSQAYLPFAKLEAIVMKAMQMAGFETVVYGNRRYDFLRYGWLAGNQRVLEFDDFSAPEPAEWIDAQMDRLTSLDGWLHLTYEGVHVGRFVIATALRAHKVGQLDFADPAIRRMLRGSLKLSVCRTIAAMQLLDRVKPDVLLVMDRGYSGYGEVFDVALRRGIDTLTWNTGYKSNLLNFKRYHTGNERMNPLTPSEDTWSKLRELPWKPEYGEQLRKELFDCYDSQDWCSVGGTQFDKRMLPQDATRRELGLTADKKVAVIFPHILWDGSFFYGEDLFGDYTQWLIEAIRGAIDNPRLQWIVKLHPAHIVKANQQHDVGRPVELDVIERTFGSLPPHVRLVPSNTAVSTYSLFQVTDYTLTVRGTVGIESALFGIPVITAGTGRYDRRGFTVDPSSREEYKRTLATLETMPRLTPEQVRLAEQYAYGVFFWRPLVLSAATLEFERDGKATPKVVINCRTRDEWLASPDMRRLSEWIADGKSEDMPGPAL